MIETRERYINGATYTVTQLPARRAIRLKAKLIRMFAPALSQVFITATEKTSDEQKKRDLLNAVEVLCSHLNENEIEPLIIDMLTGVRKNGVELTPPTIDLEFAGDMQSLYGVLGYVIETNYDNFFQMIGIGNLFSSPMTLPTESTKRTYVKK